MGLLDFMNTDEGRLGIGLLAAAMPSNVPQGQRLMGVLAQQDAWKQSQMDNKLMQAQLDDRTMQTQARRAQQEAAMQWFMERNADILEAAKIPVTNESLYASHFLGGRAAVKVLGSFDNVKIKTLVGKNVMTANDFKASMTVKEFKAWVSKKINNAFDAIAKGIPEDDAEAPADTTPPVSNVEGDTNAAEL